MSPLIEERILDEILSRVDIVEIISAYIPLKRAGRNYKACCPFHHEKTPSFMVSAEKQIFHCFGCHAGGNAFHFLMQYERMQFPEAVEFLAKKAGVSLPARRTQQHGPAADAVTQIYRINELAASFYERTLAGTAGKRCRDYLTGRGISRPVAQRFRLGCAPEGWDAFVSFARQQGIRGEALEKAGLAVARQSGGWYDRFRGRLVFPILDVKAAVIAFGARVLDDSLPKYINSPETPVYVKGRHLYGLHAAKEAIRKQDLAIVVEGYLDCIIPHQHGLHNVVASLGTALTAEQVRLLKRFTRNVCLIFDGDSAGEAASLRSLDIFLEEDVQARVVALPRGNDPDTFVRLQGAEGLKRLAAQAPNVFEYRLAAMRRQHDPRRPEGKALIVSEMLPLIRKVKDAVLAAEYMRLLGQDLGIAEEHLYAEFKKLKAQPGHALAARPAARPAQINATEKLLIQLLLSEGELIGRIRDQLCAEDFQDGWACRLVELMLDSAQQGLPLEPNSLVNRAGSEEMLELVSEASFLPQSTLAEKEHIAFDCIRRLKETKIARRRKWLHEEIKKAQASGNEGRTHELFREFHALIKRG